MKPAPDAPKRPALRYYGGKWRLAPWIISHFPPHQNYVEPCGGAASVLLQKPRSPLETYNDLDGNVVNFFRVLRDRPDELIRKIRLTPWAREEYELSLEPCEDVVERARRFFVATSMGINGSTNGHKSDWQHWRDWIDSHHKSPEKQTGDTENVYRVAYRLRYVQVEHRGYDEVITKYDHVNTLFYFDPPYVADTRAQTERYLLEWTNAQHIEAADLLRQAAGYVVISGYACPLYAELYEAHNWKRVDKEAQTNSGGKRIESLWLSPRTVEALGQREQLSF
jgi:DNA adenine methylase